MNKNFYRALPLQSLINTWILTFPRIDMSEYTSSYKSTKIKIAYQITFILNRNQIDIFLYAVVEVCCRQEILTKKITKEDHPIFHNSICWISTMRS